jgi:hypothetical protein
MPKVHTKLPQPGQLWLSQPPYLMIARVIDVEERAHGAGLVSYNLYDEDGSVLEHVNRASLDDGWWRTFQPLTRRQG